MGWLVARREAALEAVVADVEAWRLNQRHRLRLRIWDAVLDVVTLGGRL